MASFASTIVNRAAGAGPQGWAPGLYSGKDQYYTPTSDIDVSQYKRINLREKSPLADLGVYDQGQLGSCVANANCLAFWYELRLAKDSTIETSGPSRYWLYRKTLLGDQLDGFGTVGELDAVGTWNRHAGRILKNVGDCTENTCPYPIVPNRRKQNEDEEEEQAVEEAWIHDYLQKEPDPKCDAEAETHMIKAFYRLDPDRDIDSRSQTPRSTQEKDAVGVVTLDNVKKCLIEGHPVVLAFRFYWDQPPWDTSDAIWALPDVWTAPTQAIEGHHVEPDPKYGGHAVVAIGYDDAKEAILIQNSWGVDVGGWRSQGGLFWMPYAWIKDFAATNDFWTLRLEPQTYLTERQIQDKVDSVMAAS